MKLVYTATQLPVQIGDCVTIGGDPYTVHYFARPHKPSSSGKITVRTLGLCLEYYVGVIGAEWIEREDQL